MKILMIMNGNGIGGAELQFLELANHLAQRHQIQLVCMQGDQAVKVAALHDNITVSVFRYKSGKSLIAMLPHVIAKTRKHNVEAIVTTSFSGTIVGYLTGLGRRVRMLSLQTVSKAMNYPAFERIMLRRFDVLIAGCHDIRQFLLAEGHDETSISTVNNWVDFQSRVTTETTEQTRHRFGLQNDQTVIGCIGRMHPQKAQEYLVRGFLHMADQHPEAVLVLVGDGPTMPEVRAAAKDHDRIIFAGTVTGPDYTNLLACFDIYVQPSRFEGLPRTLLDAMFMQKPIVATAVNGNMDAIRPGENGILVPAEDAGAIARALVELIADPARAQTVAERAKHDAIAGFSMPVQTQKIEDLILAT
jgi:glycosyltransferase involved in cell wall biosynthesis